MAFMASKSKSPQVEAIIQRIINIKKSPILFIAKILKDAFTLLVRSFQ